MSTQQLHSSKYHTNITLSSLSPSPWIPPPSTYFPQPPILITLCTTNISISSWILYLLPFVISSTTMKFNDHHILYGWKIKYALFVVTYLGKSHEHPLLSTRCWAVLCCLACDYTVSGQHVCFMITVKIYYN